MENARSSFPNFPFYPLSRFYGVVKISGITNLKDALLALRRRDALGSFLPPQSALIGTDAREIPTVCLRMSYCWRLLE